MNLLIAIVFSFLSASILKVLQIVKSLDKRIEDLESEYNEGGVN